MSKKLCLAGTAITVVIGAVFLGLFSHHAQTQGASSAMTTAFDTTVANWAVFQNTTRTQSGMLPLVDIGPATVSPEASTTEDYLFAVSSAENPNTTITLGSAGSSTIIIDGGHSTTASTSGAANYALDISKAGQITLTDINNTADTWTINGYSVTAPVVLLFDGAATTSSGAYQSEYVIASGSSAEVAELYNAALARLPDPAGLEYYTLPIASGTMTLQQAATNFLASREFTTKFSAAALAPDNGGANDQAYVTQLYQNVLHRTPAASELAWYVNEIQTTLAGQTNYKATLLLDFAVSPEDASDVSGWLINPANGAYADPATISASAALAQASTSTAFNTSQINPSTITGNMSSPDGNIGLSVESNDQAVILWAEPSGTIDLSSEVPNIVVPTAAGSTSNVTVYGAPGGGSTITMLTGTINLSGDNNTISQEILTQTTGAPTVNGWNSTDVLWLHNWNSASSLITENPTATAPLSGSALTFSPTGPAYLINVGSVGGGSAAEVAAAANLVYKVADKSDEAAFFVGETTSGNAVVYSWSQVNAQQEFNVGADSVGNHQVSASEFAGGVTLVGVQASSLTAANFHL